MNTLKGIFPEPKAAPKRNFLKENMQSLKQMQGIVHSIRNYPAAFNKDGLQVYRRNASSRSGSHHLKSKSQSLTAPEKVKPVEKNKSSNMVDKKYENLCCRTAVESLKIALKENKNKGKDVGIQTEVITKKLYENATIIYPRTQEIMDIQTKQKAQLINRMNRAGEPQKSPTEEDIGKREPKDYVRDNAQVIPSNRKDKEKAIILPGNAPPTYRKGVVPKYLKERKEELIRQAQSTAGDERCPEGHVLLPEAERKETLRKLRQSYAELITELNLMPVRSDTLKIRNRKIELENQLKKLDEAIKVFTKPKVYIQTGA